MKPRVLVSRLVALTLLVVAFPQDAFAFKWLPAGAGYYEASSDVVSPRVTFGADGSAVLGWRTTPANPFAATVVGSKSSQMAFKPSGGAFGSALRPTGANRTLTSPVVLTKPGGGSEVVLNSDEQIVVADLSADGILEPKSGYQRVSTTDLWTADFAAATGSDGTTAVTWWEALPDHHDLQYQSHQDDLWDFRLMASVRPPGGAFGAPIPVVARWEDRFTPTIIFDRLEDTYMARSCVICVNFRHREPSLSVHVGGDGRITVIHQEAISILFPGSSEFVHDDARDYVLAFTSDTFVSADNTITRAGDMCVGSNCTPTARVNTYPGVHLDPWGEVKGASEQTWTTLATGPGFADGNRLDVAMAPDGTLAATWRQKNTLRTTSPDPLHPGSELVHLSDRWQIMAAIRPAGSTTFGTPFAVSNAHIFEPRSSDFDPSLDPNLDRSSVIPKVAIASDKTITVAWTGYDGRNMVVRATRIVPGAPIPPATQLSATGGQATGELDVATSADGLTTIVAWGMKPGASTLTGSSIAVRIGSENPLNLTRPAITVDSTRTAGNTLRCTRGTWGATASTAIQWFRSGALAQTGGDYVVTSADRGSRLTCRVVATNIAGSTTATSAEFTAPTVASIAAGGHHTCGIANSGKVMCWGRNLSGQAKPPVTLTTANAIDAGEDHTCALSSASKVVCWGSNVDGSGSTVNQSKPLTTVGVAKKVSTGAYHSCAIRASDSKVLCWGSNSAGQTTVPAALGAVVDVSAGAEHTCAVKVSGELSCWGLTTGRAPTGAAGPYARVDASSRDTCAVASTGRVDCWGALETALGAGPHSGFVADLVAVGEGRACAARRAAPVICWGDTGGGTTEPVTLAASSISFGDSHACAILEDRTAACWGGANTDGERAIPRPVSAVRSVATGASHTCAIVPGTAASIRCWGANDFGQLDPPAALAAPSALFAGGNHTCAIGTDSSTSTAARLFCWGASSSGQTTVPTGFTASTAATGDSHTCAIGAATKLVACWGLGAQGQTTVPSGLGQVSRLSAGLDFTCAIRVADQRAACWGGNSRSQTTVPGSVGSVKEIASGGFHTCAIRSTDTVACWGSNDVGESTVPATLGTVRSIAVGQYHACAVSTKGPTVCWGRRTGGAATVPAAIASAGASTVAAGPLNTCAIGTSPVGALLCWGNNDSGQSTVPSTSFPGS